MPCNLALTRRIGIKGRVAEAREDRRDSREAVLDVAARIRRLSVREDPARFCPRCFYYSTQGFPELYPDLLSALTTASLRLASSYGLRFLTLLPATISALHLIIPHRISIDAIMPCVVRLTGVEELHLRTHQKNSLQNYSLSLFLGLSTRLRVFCLEDTVPVLYTSTELRLFLRKHPRLKSLSLNPRPGNTACSGALPGFSCLDVLSDQPGQVLEEFAAFLSPDIAEAGTDSGSSSTLKILDLGLSYSGLNKKAREKGRAFVRARFPGVRLRTTIVRFAEP